MADIRQFMDVTDPAEMKKGQMERVTFVFKTITFTWNDGGVSFTDQLNVNN